MPGIVYVGGAHLKPPKPLPSKLQDYIDNAEHGVIIFSLGSFLQSSALPKDKVEVFLDAFSRLKQRVIWKYEDESLNVPSNVLVQKWLPQSDILAHPNVVLFITHGGRLNHLPNFRVRDHVHCNLKILIRFPGMSGTFEGNSHDRSIPVQSIILFN